METPTQNKWSAAARAAARKARGKRGRETKHPGSFNDRKKLANILKERRSGRDTKGRRAMGRRHLLRSGQSDR